MSKKIIKIKKIKKAIKLLKSKPTPKKLKKEKSAKSKPEKKAAKKVQVKNIVKKKPSIKKVVKPTKKIAVKKLSAKTKPTITKKINIKPLKKVVAKKEKSIVVKAKKEKEIKKTAPLVSKIKEEKTSKVELVSAKKAAKDTSDNIIPKPSRSRKRGRKKKNKGDDDEPEILHDELVEQLIRSTKKLRSQPKVPKMLKTFVNPMASLTVAAQPNDNKKSASANKKEPKGKFSVEYVIRTSAGILYEFLTTPSGLSEWFADDVNIHDGIFTFFWDGSTQKARLLGFKEEEYVKMQWMDKPEGSYFEFRIQKDDITGDVSLIITDFADEASDLETSKRLWDTQVDKLLHIIGSY